MRMTSAEYEAYLARQTARHAPPQASEGVTAERDLHDAIGAACRLRNWIYFHGNMATRTHRTVGEPDFTVLADNGRVFFIEAKTRSGKLTLEQLALHKWAEKLGHVIHTVRTMKEFYQIIQ
jgi:hypothetical protein